MTFKYIGSYIKNRQPFMRVEVTYRPMSYLFIKKVTISINLVKDDGMVFWWHDTFSGKTYTDLRINSLWNINESEEITDLSKRM